MSQTNLTNGKRGLVVEEAWTQVSRMMGQGSKLSKEGNEGSGCEG